MSRKTKITLALFLLLICLAIPTLYFSGRPLPTEIKRELHDGITYRRKVHTEPRLWIAHIITIDLHTDGIRFLVTPPDNKKSDLPLNARTTTTFLRDYNLQIAVNGGEFYPWRSNSLLDYYPHVGDPRCPKWIYSLAREKICRRQSPSIIYFR